MIEVPAILSCLRETVRRFPDRPAVSDAERTMTYRELWQAATSYSLPTTSHQLPTLKPNLVEARSSVDFAVAAIGTYLAGRVFVPFPKGAPDALLRRISEETAPSLGPDVADVLYTTGTTGASKGVVLSHRAAWVSADNNRLCDRITENTVYLIASPLNHISALRKLYACFLVGAHAVLQDGFIDVKRYYEMIERYRVNALLLPPAAALLLLRVSRERLHALDGQIEVVHSNGAPMPESLRQSLCRCLPHARLVFAYGATEIGSACCAYDYAAFPNRATCVGKASPHVKLTIEDGCIVVAGEGMMEGYIGEVGRKGVKPAHRTHDLGRIDEEGFVYVLGRSDDIINVDGMKVAPTEVEEVAMRSPQIADCACVGIDDPLTGSAVKLSVVPRDDARFDLVAFRRFLTAHLERHQIPAQIVCVTQIPRTRNGKTDRSSDRKGRGI